MQLPVGSVSPNLRTGVIENPYILISGDRLQRAADVLPLLEQVAPTGRPLVVIAEAVEGEALGTLVLNQAAAIPSPEFVQLLRQRVNEDLAVLTGGLPVTAELGVSLAAIRLSQLGQAEQVIIDANSTTIIGGAGEPGDVRRRIEHIRGELASGAGLNEFELDKLRERMARLGGRVAVIRVGADSETELLERRHRIEDAIRATRAALTEGVVAGGGAALVHARAAIDVSRRGRRGHRRARSCAGRWRSRCARSPSTRASSRRPRSRSVAGLDVARRAGRRHRRVPRPARRGRDRSGHGHALRAGQRGVDRQDRADDRVRRDRAGVRRPDHAGARGQRPVAQRRAPAAARAALRRRGAGDAAGRRGHGRRRDQGDARPARAQRAADRFGRPPDDHQRRGDDRRRHRSRRGLRAHRRPAGAPGRALDQRDRGRRDDDRDAAGAVAGAPRAAQRRRRRASAGAAAGDRAGGGAGRRAPAHAGGAGGHARADRPRGERSPRATEPSAR